MRQTGVALIPHITEYEYFLKQYGDKFDVIDFKTRDVESKISEICRYSLVLSSSLHGLIVAHAYGIPAIWIKHGYIHTDGIKFKDYFSSVNIPYYSGFENIDDIIGMGESGIRLFFERHKKLSLPHVSLQLLQKNLLKVAPFPVKLIYNHES